MNSNKQILLEISGQAAHSYYGMLSPALFGKTTLQLCETRVIERTRKVVATRYCEVLLSEVDSVEIAEEAISWLLIVGLLTIFIYGLGFILIAIYFFFKYKYLIIHSGSNAQVLCISGDANMEKAKVFMEDVLKRAEQAKPKG